MTESERDRFSAACSFVMPFGKYKGQTLARIGNNNQGLIYLDWIVGQSFMNGPTKIAIKAYLGHPAVSMQVDRLTDF